MLVAFGIVLLLVFILKKVVDVETLTAIQKAFEQISGTGVCLLVIGAVGLSLIISYRQKGIDAQIKVIDCGNDEDADYLNILDCLEDKGLCQIIERRERASELKKLAEQRERVDSPAVAAAPVILRELVFSAEAS